MKIDDMAKIAELMSKHELTEFKLESDDFNLKMTRGGTVTVAAMPAPVQAVATTPTAAMPVVAEETTNNNPTINSPIVGTFYAAPSPDADDFAKVGDRVTADTVVCIVEAMKVMNEIKAEQSGIIKKVLVDNATPVEFGQPLFELEA